MGGDSKTTSTASTSTADNRQVVDSEGVAIGAKGAASIARDQGVAVGADSVVNITQVPDEAYNLTGEVVQILGDVTAQSLQQSQADSKQIFEKLITYGIPAAAIAFVLSR